MNTLEMVFTCMQCETNRQFGTALNYNDRPDNPLVTIRCAHCGKATRHIFTKVMERTPLREQKVFSQMRSSAMSSLL